MILFLDHIKISNVILFCECECIVLERVYKVLCKLYTVLPSVCRRAVADFFYFIYLYCYSFINNTLCKVQWYRGGCVCSGKSLEKSYMFSEKSAMARRQRPCFWLFGIYEHMLIIRFEESKRFAHGLAKRALCQSALT